MLLQAGTARITITPPVGVELAGWHFGPCVGILDELEASALLLQRDDVQWALVTADLIGFGPEIVNQVRERCQRDWSIPEGNIWLAASHTHSGPATAYLRDWGTIEPNYIHNLVNQIVGLIGMALRDLRPARLGLGQGYVSNLAENRRVNGGEIDPRVPVLRVDDRSGVTMALVFGLGCHPVALHSYHNLISPDYPGYARQAIQRLMNQSTRPMFVLGTAGDQNPSGYVGGQTSPARAQQLGTILGCQAAQIALDLDLADDPVLACAREIIELPVAPLPDSDTLVQMRDTFTAQVAQYESEHQPATKISIARIKRDWASEALHALQVGVVQTSRQCEVAALRLGDNVLIALPLEVFVSTGQAIHAASPAAITWIASATNGFMGYLPTAHAFQVERDYAAPDGLAPKVCGLYALDRGAEPAVRQAAARLLTQLFSD